MEKLLTVDEVADLLRISSGSLYHWISQGRVPVVRFSKRCVRFRVSNVQQLVENLKSKSSSQIVIKQSGR